MGVKENLGAVRQAIAAAARKSGRSPDEIILVGVTKTFSLESIVTALNAGLSDIGESRLQEAEYKFPRVPPGVTKHFIGHLQGNKVRKAVALCDMVQSVDSLKIAGKISDAAASAGKAIPVLIEILTDEEKEFGVRPAELADFLRSASDMKGIRIQGLMTVGPQEANPEGSRPLFRDIKRVFDSIPSMRIKNVEMRYLSMGMSSDFAVAIEEGASMVRVGTAIFGKRARQ